MALCILNVLIIAAFLSSAACTGKTITISTHLGKIQGNSLTANSQTIFNFNGIPYAVPPIGDLRFRPSKLNTSPWNGTFDGTKVGPICCQSPQFHSAQVMDEDCLSLNIWTTKSIVDNAPKQLTPVMFWIHGGGFISGTGSEYNGKNVVSQFGDVVLVTINYRLGPLGFMNNKQFYDQNDAVPSYGGMNGLYDQIIALQWTRQFIADFGGDPDHITIFGESAGGLSVCSLLVSPLAKRLFQRAIVQSGSCVGPWGPLSTSDGITAANAVLSAIGWPADNVTFLRSLDAQELTVKMETAANNSWAIAVDQLVLSDLPRNLLSDSNVAINAAESIVVGFNSMDGIVAEPWGYGAVPETDEEYKSLIADYVDNETTQNRLYSDYYPPSDFPKYHYSAKGSYNSYQLAWWTMNGDVCVLCPSLELAERISSNVMTPQLFVYEFNGPEQDHSYRAPHASELPFVFNWGAEFELFYRIPWDQKLSDSMLSSWVHLGRDGTPEMDWHPFGRRQGNVLLFQTEHGGIRNVADFKEKYRKNVCDFWSEEVGQEIMTNVCLDQIEMAA